MPTTLTERLDGPWYSAPVGRSCDVSLDGQRVLMIKNTAGGDQSSTLPSIVVVLNWVGELKARVAMNLEGPTDRAL